MKEALKLALEALESATPKYTRQRKDQKTLGGALNYWKLEQHHRLRAITAIKQALKAPVQEPVASYKGPEELWLQLHGDCSDDELTEPVDYTDDSVTWCWHQIHDSDVRYVRADLATPPAAQRQWIGLDEEEIKITWHDIDGSEGMLIRFARAIEAKLKEKNT